MSQASRVRVATVDGVIVGALTTLIVASITVYLNIDWTWKVLGLLATFAIGTFAGGISSLKGYWPWPQDPELRNGLRNLQIVLATAALLYIGTLPTQIQLRVSDADKNGIEQLKGEVTTAVRDLQAAAKANSDVRVSLANADTLVDKLKSAVASKKASSIDKAKSDFEKHVKDLVQQLETRKNDSLQLAKNLNAALGGTKRLEQEGIQLEADINLLRSEIDSLMAQLSSAPKQ